MSEGTSVVGEADGRGQATQTLLGWGQKLEF